MFSKRSLSALSSSERQWLRSQWLRSGQCARCFHASLRRAEDQGASSNGPKKGETRAQRSARISTEVAMLQKGPPPSTSTAATAEREGPISQGLATPNQSDQAVLGVEEESSRHHRDGVNRSARRDEEGEMEEDGEGESPDDNTWSKPAPIKPRIPTHDNLLHGGRGAATIAGGNFQGVIRDRLKAVSFPHSPDAPAHQRRWVKLNPLLKRELVEKFVEGKYDQRGVLQTGQGVQKHPVLKDIARMTLLNGSYLAGDGDKLMEKVRSLLPIPSPAAAKGKQRAKQMKK